MAAPAASGGWRILMLLGITVVSATAAVCWARASSAEDSERAGAARLMNELMSGKVKVGGPFTLTDQHGDARSLADFRGKLVLLYFGYTFCPDVCPTDLLAIANLIRVLGTEGDAVQPVFVTLDPERDKQEAIGNYATAFHPRFIALRGSEHETRRVATAYKVYYKKVTPRNSRAYVIDHTAFIFLIDREGKYVAFFPPGTNVERMTVMVREALHRPG